MSCAALQQESGPFEGALEVNTDPFVPTSTVAADPQDEVFDHLSDLVWLGLALEVIERVDAALVTSFGLVPLPVEPLGFLAQIAAASLAVAIGRAVFNVDGP